MITVRIGVKEGGSWSGLLIVLLDALPKMLKDACINYGYIDPLHSLMVMDDTVIVATLRENLQKQFHGLVRFCNECDTVINEGNTSVIIKCTVDDRRGFH